MTTWAERAEAQRQSIFDVWPDAEYPGLHRDIHAALAAAVDAERQACAKALEALPTENDDEFYTLVAAIAAIRARNGRE